VYVRPRGHGLVRTSASEALRRIDVPVLLVHGSDDAVIPVGHLHRLATIETGTGAPAETLEIAGGQHSWLYEFPIYRRTVAAFLARSLGGIDPETAAARAEAVDARRLPDLVRPPTQIELEPGGFRSLARIATPLRRPGDHPDGIVEESTVPEAQELAG
jgi:hypothetical protein